MLSHLNTCSDFNEIKKGDLLVIQRKRDKRRILVQAKELLRNDGQQEVVMSTAKNDYFNFGMYMAGESWVWRVWNLGQVELTNITNNMNEFPR